MSGDEEMGKPKPDLGKIRIEIVDDKGELTILDPGGRFAVFFRGQFIDCGWAGYAIRSIKVIYDGVKC